LIEQMLGFLVGLNISFDSGPKREGSFYSGLKMLKQLHIPKISAEKRLSNILRHCY